MSDATVFRTAAETLGVPLTERQVEQFDLWRDLLQRWNRAQKLTAEDDDDHLWRRHFVDTLLYTVALELPPDGARVADVGAGAGLPGLGLAILLPGCTLTLMESQQRRAAFLSEVQRQLGLSNVEVEARRLEVIGQDPAHRETYDRVVARRVAALNILLEYGLPLLQAGGRAVFAKGEQLEAELAAAAGVAELLGGGAPVVRTWPIPALRSGEPPLRRFVLVDKVGATPAKYPRRTGRPDKQPLRVEHSS